MACYSGTHTRHVCPRRVALMTALQVTGHTTFSQLRACTSWMCTLTAWPTVTLLTIYFFTYWLFLPIMEGCWFRQVADSSSGMCLAVDSLQAGYSKCWQHNLVSTSSFA